MRPKSSVGDWFWPLILVALGIVLLLNSFLLISGFSVTALLPLIFVVAGGVLVIRGDWFAGGVGKNFGITRGSVESAALEISAGAIDVTAYALQKEGRLIAGQFAPDSRPQLAVDGATARLRMDRAATPFFAFTPWTVALARDIPWKLYVTTHLGQIALDLSGLIVDGGVIASGFGDIELTAPAEALSPLVVRSALGSIRVIVPSGYNVRVAIRKTRLFRVRVDENRHVSDGPGVYLSRDADPGRPQTTLIVSGTFGDAYLL